MKAPGSDQDDIDTKPVCEKKEMDGWQLDRLEWCFHYKALEGLLSSDPFLKILKPKLLGSLCGPISAPLQTSN